MCALSYIGVTVLLLAALEAEVDLYNKMPNQIKICISQLMCISVGLLLLPTNNENITFSLPTCKKDDIWLFVDYCYKKVTE